MANYLINSINGIWNSYGCPPDEGEGVSISVYHEDNLLNNSTGSLKDLLGITDTKKNIGQIADFKKISELVVLLPMSQPDPGVESNNVEPPPPPTLSSCGECIKKTCKSHNVLSEKDKLLEKILVKNTTENAKLFRIQEDIVNKILGTVDYRDPKLKYTIFDFKRKLESRKSLLNLNNNIVKLMFAMVNYYFPPHLNWLFDTSIDPIAMYVAEFSSTLTKNDLSNIWQGTMPSLAQEPEEEEIEIEHFLSTEEIFGGYDINDIENLKMSVFKCKKIANADYNLLLKYVEQKDLKNWYNYNWPYDNFSLIELAQIQVGEVHDFKNDISSDRGVLGKDIEQTFSDGQTTYTVPVK